MVDWNAMVGREGPAVWRTVYRIVGNRADAEDCFQDTFVAALNLWRRQPVRHPHALLQRLATARALDRLRARYRKSRREGGSAHAEACCASEPGPLQLAQAAELSDRLRAALAALPARQAQAFCLFHLDGWDYQRIAIELDATGTAVGVLLHRARHRLRELLGEPALAEPSQTGKSHA